MGNGIRNYLSCRLLCYADLPRVVEKKTSVLRDLLGVLAPFRIRTMRLQKRTEPSHPGSTFTGSVKTNKFGRHELLDAVTMLCCVLGAGLRLRFRELLWVRSKGGILEVCPSWRNNAQYMVHVSISVRLVASVTALPSSSVAATEKKCNQDVEQLRNTFTTLNPGFCTPILWNKKPWRTAWSARRGVPAFHCEAHNDGTFWSSQLHCHV